MMQLKALLAKIWKLDFLKTRIKLFRNSKSGSSGRSAMLDAIGTTTEMHLFGV